MVPGLRKVFSGPEVRFGSEWSNLWDQGFILSLQGRGGVPAPAPAAEASAPAPAPAVPAAPVTKRQVAVLPAHAAPPANPEPAPQGPAAPGANKRKGKTPLPTQ